MFFERTLYVATDHAGFAHKEAVKSWLLNEGCTVIDVGANHYDEGDDFPDFIRRAAQKVSQEPETTAAIIFGGSGQGEAMVANRFVGVRATVYYGSVPSIITLSREHNDANIICIPARFVREGDVEKMIQLFLTTEFEGGRHLRRVEKISEGC